MRIIWAACYSSYSQATFPDVLGQQVQSGTWNLHFNKQPGWFQCGSRRPYFEKLTLDTSEAMKDELLSPISILIITHSFVRASLYQIRTEYSVCVPCTVRRRRWQDTPWPCSWSNRRESINCPSMVWLGGAGYKHSGHKGGCLAHTVVTEGAGLTS